MPVRQYQTQKNSEEKDGKNDLKYFLEGQSNQGMIQMIENERIS